MIHQVLPVYNEFLFEIHLLCLQHIRIRIGFERLLVEVIVNLITSKKITPQTVFKFDKILLEGCLVLNGQTLAETYDLVI